jgi:hypothetical protein
MIGKRIKLIKMFDVYPIEPGTLGTIIKVSKVSGDNILEVKWDDGRGLNLIDGVDEYEIIE